MSRPPFPSVLDSSLVAAFRSCPEKSRLEYFEHWKGGRSVHLVAGAAYAAGLEAARLAYHVEHKHPDDCIAAGLSALMHSYGDFECPSDSPKSLERTLGALEFYFHAYPLETDKAVPIVLPSGKAGIEFSFAEPIDATHPETGDPLIYCGRMDMIVKYESMILLEDDKTTSQLGASWPLQWDLRSQFTGYAWGCQRAGIKVDGALVRGLSILKTKYDTMEAITYRPQWMIDRWYGQLLRDVARMKASWESGEWDLSLDHACSEYGGCPFRRVCLMPDPTQLLEMQFERRRWDPISRTETAL